jgi:putative oxidoreductase
MNAGLLIIRVLLGLVLLAHSTQKMMGWLQGPGLDASSKIFEALGHRPGRAMVTIAAGCELIAALSLLLGLATPVGAAIASGTLLVAGLSQTARASKLWNALGGGEYPLVLAILALALGFTGPGAWAIDRALFDDYPPNVGIGVLAIAVLAAMPPSLRSRRDIQRMRAAESASQ